jgi:mannose-6-phosphate isomerase-like protein (cupin superfamily)/predicted nucleotidyltransferase
VIRIVYVREATILAKRAAGAKRQDREHGSVARGEAGADSDIDIVVELDRDRHIGLFGLVALERRLSGLLGRKVDLLPEPVEKKRLQANIDPPAPSQLGRLRDAGSGQGQARASQHFPSPVRVAEDGVDRRLPAIFDPANNELGTAGGSGMAPMGFETRRRAAAPDATAPDGAEVRILCATGRGSMAVFSLAAGKVSKAVAHRTVEEIWYFTRGAGRMWRRSGDREEVTDIGAGVSLSIPVGTHFQFRCDGGEPLEAVAVTMPPWPGDGEAYLVAGRWPPNV